MTTTGRAPVRGQARDSIDRRVFGGITGLAAVAVLLQGLWAGLFLEYDGQRDAAGSWIEVHARGGEIAIVLAVVATVWFRLRARRDLLFGALALTVALVVEAYVSGLLVDDGQDFLTPVHIPLALLVMGLAVWLPFRAAVRTPDEDRV
ncbi:hypothetical protein ACI784_17330 [Geodermatophilus sp. SYSU D01186]